LKRFYDAGDLGNGLEKTGIPACLSLFSVFNESMSNELPPWEKAREEFVAQWGSLGTQWGINRTMAQIHALLMTAPEPMCTDEVMEKLQISRGNAHTNLKDLVGWNLVRIITKKGDRKEYFEAEKDVWKIFITISKERKRREIEPAIHLLRDCAAQTKDEASRPWPRLPPADEGPRRIPQLRRQSRRHRDHHEARLRPPMGHAPPWLIFFMPIFFIKY
jgi:DNA-binding transcriptional regulator GbsR (MarR family)